MRGRPKTKPIRNWATKTNQSFLNKKDEVSEEASVQLPVSTGIRQVSFVFSFSIRTLGWRTSGTGTQLSDGIIRSNVLYNWRVVNIFTPNRIFFFRPYSDFLCSSKSFDRPFLIKRNISLICYYYIYLCSNFGFMLQKLSYKDCLTRHAAKSIFIMRWGNAGRKIETIYQDGHDVTLFLKIFSISIVYAARCEAAYKNWNKGFTALQNIHLRFYFHFANDYVLKYMYLLPTSFFTHLVNHS